VIPSGKGVREREAEDKSGEIGNQNWQSGVTVETVYRESRSSNGKEYRHVNVLRNSTSLQRVPTLKLPQAVPKMKGGIPEP